MAHGSGRHGGAAVRRRKVPASTVAAAAEEAPADAPPDEFRPLAIAKRLKHRWDALTTWQGYALTTVVIAGPYAAWLLYMWLRLQSGLLRGAVSATTPRAVLIVGTQSSGTTQMSRALANVGLEVGHETSDCSWSFARDGTISWMHGMRFMPGNATEANIVGLCKAFRKNMGFHPAAFGPPRLGCSYRATWDACWRAECSIRVAREWGCARRGDCETPFSTSLLQLRHPARTMESLAAKFCVKAEDAPHFDFVAVAAALWPEKRLEAWRAAKCFDAVGWYAALYARDMLDARDAGEIDGVYRVEETEPCAVAAMAGLAGNTKTRRKCGFGESASSQTNVPGGVETKSTAKGANERNRGRVRVEIGRDVRSAELRFLLGEVARRGGYEELV